MASRSELMAGLAQVEVLLKSGEPLEISAAVLPQGIRVLMGAGTKMLAMGVKEARRMADTFDTPEARAVGLNVADDLRTAADAAEAYGATKQ